MKLNADTSAAPKPPARASNARDTSRLALGALLLAGPLGAMAQQASPDTDKTLQPVVVKERAYSLCCAFYALVVRLLTRANTSESCCVVGKWLEYIVIRKARYSLSTWYLFLYELSARAIGNDRAQVVECLIIVKPTMLL